MDRVSARSRNMAAIRGKDTKPEMLVRRYLHRSGLRYRLHVRGLPGRPDMVFPRFRTVVFVNGCFWHRHTGCRNSAMPVNNRKFWQEKLEGNVARDKRNITELRRDGWRVHIIWECEINESTLENLSKSIRLQT